MAFRCRFTTVGNMASIKERAAALNLAEKLRVRPQGESAQHKVFVTTSGHVCSLKNPRSLREKTMEIKSR